MLQEKIVGRMTTDERRKYERPSAPCGETYVVEEKRLRPYGWGSGVATGALATYELMERMGMPEGYMKYAIFGAAMLFGGSVGTFIAGRLERGIGYISNRIKGNQDELEREEERLKQERDQFI